MRASSPHLPAPRLVWRTATRRSMLHAHTTGRAAPGLRWRPLSFITSLLRLPNFNQLNLHSNIAMRNSSSRFGEHLGTEAFPVFHHRPDNPSEFVGERDGQ